LWSSLKKKEEREPIHHLKRADYGGVARTGGVQMWGINRKIGRTFKTLKKHRTWVLTEKLMVKRVRRKGGGHCRQQKGGEALTHDNIP